MSKKLTRKAIKKDIREDEFRSTVERMIDWFEDNKGQVIVATVAIVALALVGSVVSAVMENRRTTTDEMLADAVKVVNAPIDEDAAQPDDPQNPTFANAEARDSRAKEALTEIQERGGDAGDMASLYLADMALADGDRDTARSLWEAFLANQGDHMLSTSVRLNLIRLRRDSGEAQQVADELTAELDRSNKSLPEDAILFELAKTLESLDRSEEAKEFYQRIIDEFPQSSFTAQARQATT